MKICTLQGSIGKSSEIDQKAQHFRNSSFQDLGSILACLKTPYIHIYKVILFYVSTLFQKMWVLSASSTSKRPAV